MKAFLYAHVNALGLLEFSRPTFSVFHRCDWDAQCTDILDEAVRDAVTLVDQVA